MQINSRLAAASDRVYQLLAHGRWYSAGTPASLTTKTGRHDIAEILLKVALNTIDPQNKAKRSSKNCSYQEILTVLISLIVVPLHGQTDRNQQSFKVH
jgi:hypothetical protein